MAARKVKKKAKSSKSSKKPPLTVETFAVRQVAVNLVTIDARESCPQSTVDQYYKMTPMKTCPDPSVICPRVTISGYVALVGVPPLSPENLTTLLNHLPTTPFKKMTLTVVASTAKHDETVKAIKKAQ